MGGISPDQYRRAAGFRRSEAPAAASPNTVVRPVVRAYTAHSLEDPALADFMRGGRENVAGVAISARTALRNATFFRACSLIAGSVGMLPLHLIRRKADGKTEKAKDHPLYRVLHRRPNNFQSPSEFKSYMQLVALLDGNAYALVIRSGRQIRELVPLPRKSVTPKLSAEFGLTFEYRRPGGGTSTLLPRDLFHFRAPLSLDGVTGVSLLDVAADTLGIAMKAEAAVGKLMSKGVMAGGSLETAQALGDEAIENLRESLAERHSGADNAGDWMVLEQGLTAKPFATSARDAQLVELRKQEAEEMARFTGVPRPLLMFDETSWGSGIEQLGLFFVTYCLLAWFVIWEEAIWRLLEPAEQEAVDGSMLYAKINERALLRGSMKEQAEFMAKALGSGGGEAWITQNEARDNFDLNPLDGGDDLPRRGTSAATILEEKQNG